MVDRLGDGLLSPDADGFIEIDGVKTETDINKKLSNFRLNYFFRLKPLAI